MEYQDLLDILTIKRPYLGEGETEIANKYLAPLGVREHVSGNWMITLGKSKTCFTSHLDTVHKLDGIQKIVYDSVTELVYKDDDEPLGADDGAGVWLMMEMIKNKVPGFYLFCVGEERGCIGSTDMATNHEYLFNNIDRVISFDRKGKEDVITFQLNSRCCSDTFANALASKLGPRYEPVDGVVTDSASFMELVPECTNISVGYEGEHTKHEYLDVKYLVKLRNTVIKLDWESLPTARDPSIVEMQDWNSIYSGWGVWEEANHASHVDNELYPEEYGLTPSDLLNLIYQNPEAVADFLADQKYTTEEWNELFQIHSDKYAIN